MLLILSTYSADSKCKETLNYNINYCNIGYISYKTLFWSVFYYCKTKKYHSIVNLLQCKILIPSWIMTYNSWC